MDFDGGADDLTRDNVKRGIDQHGTTASKMRNLLQMRQFGRVVPGGAAGSRRGTSAARAQKRASKRLRFPVAPCESVPSVFSVSVSRPAPAATASRAG